MRRPSNVAFLVLLMLLALSPVLGACSSLPYVGAEHSESDVLPNPI